MRSADVSEADIEAAFAGVRLPPGDRILHDNCYDIDSVYDFLQYAGRSWRDLPPKVIVDNYDRLPFLSADAFRAVLPAFLLYSIRYPDSNVALFTWYAITPTCKDSTNARELEVHRQSQLIALREPERNVVNAVASFLASRMS